MSNDPARGRWNRENSAASAGDEPPASMAAPPATLRDPGLVGREALVERLQSAIIAQTVRGAFLSGSSGIGKTLAAKELVCRLEGAGYRVLTAACYPDMPPLSAWQQIVGTVGVDGDPAATEAMLRAQQQQLSTAQRDSAVARDVARQQLFERLAESAVAGSGRTLIWIDDLQWADPDSLALLERTLRAQPERVLVATLNTEAGAEAVTRARELCVRVDRSTVVELGPLGRVDVACYLERALGAAPYEGWVRALHARSGGHPLFLRELVQALVDRGFALEKWTATPELDGILPPLLRELLQGRGRRVGQEAARVVRAACVLEGELDVSLLVELCGYSRAQLLACFGELSHAGILEAQVARPGQWRFVHGLVREAFYDGLDATERAELHLRAAAAFGDRAERSGGFALVQAAHHLRQALPLSEPEEVVRACRRAARWQAAQGACLDAARLEEQAFVLTEQHGLGSARDRLAHALRLGRLYLVGGLMRKSIGTYTQAIERARALGRPRVQVEAVLGLSAALGWGRHPNHAEERPLVEALSLVSNDSPLRARLLARRAVLRSYRGMAPEEVDMAREALELAAKHRSSRDARAWLEANRALHCALQGPAHLEERAALAQRILGLQEQQGLSEHNYSVREELAGERLMQGDRAGYEALLAEGRRAAEQHPQFAWLHQVACTAPAILEGRWEEAERRIRKACEVGTLTESPQVRPAALGQELAIRRAQGRASELLEQVVPVAAGLGWVGAYPQAALAALYVEVGDDASARAVFEPLADGWLVRPYDNVDDWLITAAELAWVAFKLGDRARGRQIAQRLRPYSALHAVLPPVNLYAGPIARSLGLLAELDGDSKQAVDWLERARAACLAIGATVMRDAVDAELASIRRSAHAGQPDEFAVSSAAGGEPLPQTDRVESSRTERDVGDSASTAPSARTAPRSTSPSETAPPASAALVRCGEGWLVRYQDRESFVGDLLGVRYLAELLAHPHCALRARALVELRSMPTADGSAAAASDPSLNLQGSEHRDQALDEQALSAYRARLVTLDEQLEQARAHSDLGRVDRLEHEKEALLKELSRALNLFGRPRAIGSRDERARVSCTRAIRKALAALTHCDPALGAHLDASIRTGHECVYVPAVTVEWVCQP